MPEMTEEQRRVLEEKLKNMSPEELAKLQKQQCIFCQIISRKIPTKKIFEDEKCLAILDINPAAKGHLLLIPKEHYAIMPQVPEELLNHLTTISKKLSQILLRALKVSGTNIFIANGPAAGQRAQHFLVHIIPRKELDKIMDWDEKLITKEYQHQIGSLVESKLYLLMGLDALKREPTLSVTPEDELPTETPVKQPESDKENSTHKTAKKRKFKHESDKDHNTKKDNDTEREIKKESKRSDVSLDDIANLFK
ncbi:HIT domain-containing protein [Candidatus Woesearchaeota archaeon]|nr:HIT domain-containing protein [Candidatus Woesearchaeota archaeon]